MSDAFSPPPSAQENTTPYPPTDYSAMDPAELAIVHAKSERKKIITALENGTLCCLPGPDGFADTQAAKNVVNNTIYQGSFQLLLKEFQQRNSFPTPEFLTFDQIEQASDFARERIIINKGSHGITLNFLAGGEQQSVRLFNIAQLDKPHIVLSYAAHLDQSRETLLKEKYGERYIPPVKANGPENQSPITCTSSNPGAYLGQYLAALSTGRKFYAGPEEAQGFKEKMSAFIFEVNPQGHINPFNLSRLGSIAKEYCKNYLSDMHHQPREETQRKEKKSPSRSKPVITR